MVISRKENVVTDLDSGNNCPIVVYLDLNHYIDLAKDIKNQDLRRVNRLTSLFDSGRALFPISAAHLMEISSIQRPDQRQDLAGAIRMVAKGHVFRPFNDIMYLEVRSRVAEHYGKSQQFSREDALTTGFLNAIGEIAVDFTPWRELNRAKSLIAEEQFFKIISDDKILSMMVAAYHPKIAPGSAEHCLIAEAVRKDRELNKGKSLQIMRDECLLGLSRRFIALAWRAGADLGLSESEMFANPPKHFWNAEYMATIPTINCWAKLNALLYRNPTVEVKVNHLYDFAHLAVAIPYSTVVIADKEMAHTIESNKLHTEFGTVVFRRLDDLFDIPELLAGGEGGEAA